VPESSQQTAAGTPRGCSPGSTDPFILDPRLDKLPVDKLVLG
jgi:hypothetical protein